MSSSEEGQNPEQSPKMSSGFQCFVCGKQFGTNEERIEHLEKAAHGSMYDTASPQEREGTRRTSIIYTILHSHKRQHQNLC